MTRGATFWVCLECGERIVDAALASSDPIAAFLPRMPHVIAVALDEYVRETSPYLKLHRLTAAAETFTRFCTVVVLGDLLVQHRDGFPEKVRGLLAEKLDRPTFGAWRDLLDTGVRASIRKKSVLPELLEFVDRHLLPLLTDVIPLRNLLAHSGRLSPGDELAFIATYKPRFDTLVAAAAFLGGVRVIGSPSPGHAFLLAGLHPPGQPFPPFDLSALSPGTPPPPPDRVLLLAHGRTIDLFPLHAYGDVFHCAEKGHEDARATGVGSSREASFESLPEASPTSLLYFRRGVQAYLEYTAFSPNATHSQEGSVALERFNQIFRIEEWRRIERARAALGEFDFSPWHQELRGLFVGREAQIREVADWATRTTTGLCWIHGHPGVGKSAFMADLTARFFTDSRKSCKIEHFFRATDPRCSRMKFLENALLQLFASFDRHEALEGDPRKRAEQFARVLNEISVAQSAAPPGAGRRVVFMLDAVDEVSQNERDFVNVVFQGCLPGVLWVCTGRDEFGLGAAFRDHRAYLPFGSEGLPPLTDGNVREILDQECGRQIYELIARDRPDAPPGENANPFLTELVRRSGGLPIYLRLLVKDVCEGRLSFREGEERRLPNGLGSYYERILERLQVSDVSAVLTPVFCLLAVARAPLTADTILLLMAEDRLLRRAGGPDLLRRALDFGHLMLKRVVVNEQTGAADGAPASETGYTLYHESFSDHLLRSHTVKESIGAANEDFIRFVERWQDCRDQLFPNRYIVRFGPGHLADSRCWGALENLLTTLAFLEAKVEAGLAFGLAADLRTAWEAEPATRPCRPVLRLLSEALARDLHFIARHPTTLFQCLWNSCWWYDCVEAADYYVAPEGGWPVDGPPWSRAGNRLSHLLESWRSSKDAGPLPWLRSLRPPVIPLGGAQQTVCGGHVGKVGSVVYHPGGRWVASGSDDQTVKLWDSRTGETLATLRGHTGAVSCVAVSPDGQRIVSSSRDRTVRVWDARRHAQERVITVPDTAVSAVSLSPDGRTIVGACDDKTLRVWNWETGVETACLRGHEFPAVRVAFSPDGRWIASAGGHDKTARIWNVANGIEERALRHEQPVSWVAFSHDGTRIASTSHDCTVRVWEVARGGEQLRIVAQDDGTVSCVAFSSDDSRLVTGSGGWLNDHSVRVWDAKSGGLLLRLLGHENDVVGASFSPDGDSVVSGSWDGTVRIWQLEGVAAPHRLRGHEPWGNIDSLASSSDGLRFVTASMDRSVRMWSADTGIQVFLLDLRETGGWGNMSAAFSPDGLWLASVEQEVVRVREASGGVERQCLRGHKGSVNCIDFSTDGRRIVTGGSDRTVRVWDVESGVELLCLRGHEDLVTCTAFSRDGRRIVTASFDRTVREWDSADGSELHCLRGHEKPVSVVAVSPDGGRIGSRSGDRTVRVWDADTGAPLLCLVTEEDDARQLSFSADGQTIISSAPSPASVRIWNVGNGEVVGTLRGNSDVAALAAGPAAFPWRAVSDRLETWVDSAGSGEVVGWFPAALDRVVTHAGGRTWAGTDGGNVYLFTLVWGHPSAGGSVSGENLSLSPAAPE